MSNGKKIAVGIAVLVLVALVSGLTTMAVTNYGSRDDPLVTLSYLNDTLTPMLEERFNQALDARVQAMTEEFRALVESQGQDQGQGDAGGSQPSGFAVLTLNNGQTVTCGVGTEIMLRLGTAVSAGPDSPRLIDETGGESVASAGASLAVNHMYMVTIKGNGITATRDNTKILIRGEYTVG